MTSLFYEKIYQNKKPYGYIELLVDKVTYILNVHLFGMYAAAETVKTDNYNLALHKFVILKNKYNERG